MIPTLPRTSIQSLFVQAFTSSGRLVIWLPMLMYFALKVSVMFFYLATVRGPLQPLWAFGLDATAAARLDHYPWDLLLMPVIMANVELWLEVVVGVILQGATFLLFMAAMEESRLSLGDAMQNATRRWLHLFGVALVASLVLFLWFWLWEEYLRGLRIPFRMRSLTQYGVAAAVQALFVYAIPLVLADGLNAPKALWTSVRLAVSSPLRSLVIVLVPLALTWPATFLSGETRVLVDRLSPEILVHVQIAQEIIHVPAMVILFGALAALFHKRS